MRRPFLAHTWRSLPRRGRLRGFRVSGCASGGARRSRPAHPLASPAVLATVLTGALLAVACAGEPAGDPERAAPAVLPPAAGGATVESLSLASGPPGESVTLRASGLPPETRMEIGFGSLRGQYEVLDEARTGPAGGLTATVAVPAWAEAGRTYSFVVARVNQPPSAASDAFLVTDPDGDVQIRGRITDEGVECLALRSEDDDLFSLAGATQALQPGDLVTVTGRVAEMSFCMQGITLDVAQIERG